mmetsp:Transcript_10742/g.14224  ORF Transcript_10742/g.14224 Transcript_10742/m.14224 type:complete len:92 (-) Transcript_10742:15-290(-)
MTNRLRTEQQWNLLNFALQSMARVWRFRDPVDSAKKKKEKKAGQNICHEAKQYLHAGRRSIYNSRFQVLSIPTVKFTTQTCFSVPLIDFNR